MKAITGLIVLALASTAVGEDSEERKRASAEVRKMRSRTGDLHVSFFPNQLRWFWLSFSISANGAASARLRVLPMQFDLTCL